MRPSVAIQFVTEQSAGIFFSFSNFRYKNAISKEAVRTRNEQKLFTSEIKTHRLAEKL